MSKIARSTKPAKSSAKPAADRPIPYMPARVRRGPLVPTAAPMDLPCGVDLFPEVRTLADIGLTAARVQALAYYTHNLHMSSPHQFDDGPYSLRALRPRGRVLAERLGWLVLLITEREEGSNEADHGHVMFYGFDWDHEARAHRYVTRQLGAIDLGTGRFVDVVEYTERDYRDRDVRMACAEVA